MLEQKATELLQQFADSLGVTAQHLWGVLLRQAHTEAIFRGEMIYWGWWIIGILAGLFILLAIFEIISDSDTFFGIGLSFLLILCGGAFMFNAYKTVYYIQSNPEYWALEKIMEVIK